jgi:hypothetical protein
MAGIDDVMNQIAGQGRSDFLQALQRIAAALEGIDKKLDSVISKRERAEGGNVKRWSVIRTDNRE